MTEEQIRDCEGCDWLGLVEIGRDLTIGAWVDDDKIEVDWPALEVKWGDAIIIDTETFAVLGTSTHLIPDPSVAGLARRALTTLQVRLRT